jgi:hypothetical protein
MFFFENSLCSEAKFLDLNWGDIVDSGTWLLYRLAGYLGRQAAGRYDNPVTESTISPIQRLWICYCNRTTYISTDQTLIIGEKTNNTFFCLFSRKFLSFLSVNVREIVKIKRNRCWKFYLIFHSLLNRDEERRYHKFSLQNLQNISGNGSLTESQNKF